VFSAFSCGDIFVQILGLSSKKLNKLRIDSRFIFTWVPHIADLSMLGRASNDFGMLERILR
jgi:hypothetical protein